MSFFVPTKFVWRFGGNQVHLCGSFTRWVETVPMTPLDGQAGSFSVVVHLPPGYHQYKFIVDGEWRHDETQPFMPDPLGNVNNWLFVRKPEASHGSLSQAQQAAPAAPAAPAAAAASPAQPGVPPSDVDMAGGGSGSPAADGVMAPIAVQADEPAFTQRRVSDFLSAHTAYELVPESGKVVLLDMDLPMRQAFHALHEQGIASAPLWDSAVGAVCGMISASDFILMLQRLRSVATSSANPLSEREMDYHTIRALRDDLAAEGRPPHPLLAVHPEDSLKGVVGTLFKHRCSMAPVLCAAQGVADHRKVAAAGPSGAADATAQLALHQVAQQAQQAQVPSEVLHIATISGVLACLMRHFRASLASLPLLAQPLSKLPLGTWAAELAPPGEAEQRQGEPGRDRRRYAQLITVAPSTPLTTALHLLLEVGVSCLPVVDPGSGALLDIYARADISTLAKGNAYTRLQWEDVTVSQALALAAAPAPPAQLRHWGSPGTGSTGGGGSTSSLYDLHALPAGGKQRLHMATQRDTLRAVVERLSVPGVRRLVVVDGESRRVEGIISLSDVARYLLL